MSPEARSRAHDCAAKYFRWVETGYSSEPTASLWLMPASFAISRFDKPVPTSSLILSMCSAADGAGRAACLLLRYLSNLELRHVINTATAKSERFNKFVQWVAFGGDSVIAENVRDEQRKFIKYHHLFANLLAFHNVVAITNAVHRMEA